MGRILLRIERLVFLGMVILCTILFLPSGGAAVGLKVSPAGLIVHNITPGETYDLYQKTGVRLTIFNDDEVSHTYLLSVHRPSEAGSWEKGYSEIPEPGWLWFEEKEVKVEPKGRAYANLFFRIPKEKKYFNQHWVAALGILGKPDSGIALGVYVRIQIETESKEEIRYKPDGTVGIVPSCVVFRKKGETKRVTIYNNDKVPRTFRITALEEKERLKTYLSSGFQHLPDRNWLILSKNILKINPGEKRSFEIRSSLPETREASSGKWEEIFFLEDGQLNSFFRVQIVEESGK